MADSPAMAEVSFDSLPLDDRLRKAIAHIGWQSPTLIQAKALPLALRGKDVLARARTGSGKTGAYALPILQKILDAEGFNTNTQVQRTGPKAVVLVPTKELVEQVRQVFLALTHFAPSVSIAALTADQPLATHKSILATHPHVLISTPARIAQHLKAQHLKLRQSLEVLVLDEADLLLSYGFDADIKAVTEQLPNICQSILMSATLSEEVDQLKALVMNNPVTLKLEEDSKDEGQLTQFSLRCSTGDKFLLSYVLLKLGILTGKVLFFVNKVDRCYELKLFLEQFSVRCAVLNSELPQNSRANIIKCFNKGLFNYVIATDEAMDSPDADEDDMLEEAAEEEEEEEEEEGAEEEGEEEEEEEEEEEGAKRKGSDKNKGKQATVEDAEEEDEDEDEEDEDEDEDEEEEEEEEEEKEAKAKAGKKGGKGMADDEERAQRQKDLLSGAGARGIAKAKIKDLKKMSKAADGTRDKEYGVMRGLDFKNVDTVVNFDLPQTLRAYTHRCGRTARGGSNGTALSLVAPEEAAKLAGLVAKQAEKGQAVVQPLPFNLNQVEGFRYRAEDSLRRVSKLAIKRARLKELEAELMNAETLKEHFAMNPLDLKALHHDRSLAPTRVQPHLAKVPNYLLPPALKTQMAASKREAKRSAAQAWGGGGGKKKQKTQDPLKSFEAAEGNSMSGGGVMWDEEKRSQKLKARYERKRRESAKKKKEKSGRGSRVGTKAKRARA